MGFIGGLYQIVFTVIIHVFISTNIYWDPNYVQFWEFTDKQGRHDSFHLLMRKKD